MDAWRKTRADKDPVADKVEILKDWVARLSKYVVDEVANVKRAIAERLAWSKEAEFSVEAAQEREGLRAIDNEALMWQNALRRATERTATASKHDLVGEYLKEVMRVEKWTDLGYAEMIDRLKKQIKAGNIFMVKEQTGERFTSLELLTAERNYMQFAGVDSAFGFAVDGREAARYIKDLNEFNRRRGRKVLSDIQGQAVFDILTSKNMINVVQGDAGAGKTTSLKAVAEYYRQQGLDVVGLAMQGVAAKKLADEAGIEALTLKSYLGRKGLSKNKVLIFDEASMLDSRSAARLFKMAEQSGDKILLVGDKNQLESINAGKVFERFVDYYKRMGEMTKAVKLVVMNENYRQRNQVIRQAVGLAKDGKMVESLDTLQKDGRIVEIVNEKARRDAVAGLYDKDTLIIVSTSAARDDINKKIRRGLQAAGELQNGRTYSLARADDEGIQHPRAVELAPGDMVCFVKNEYQDYDIRNGEKAQVLECGEKHLKVRTEDQRELTINIEEYRNIDYGYALTTYKSQGQTYNKVIVESDTHVPSLVDMRNQYVNITRSRDEIQIFTDDIDDLKELAGVKTHARDTLDIPIQTEDIDKKNRALSKEVEAALPAPQREQLQGHYNDVGLDL
jgi:ATP-dependent exoDNAse (exonuclease V) alpha subunit